MNFIQGLLDFSHTSDQKELEELLLKLNHLHRTVFQRSIKHHVNPQDMTGKWLKEDAILQDLKPEEFTSHQRGMAVRAAAGTRKTMAATQMYLVGAHMDQVGAVSEKLKKLRATLALCQKPRVPASLERQSSFEQRMKEAKKLQQSINKVEERKCRLEASAAQAKKDAASGEGSRVFGSRKLLQQRSLLGTSSSPFKNKSDWHQAWIEARNQAWLFEGSKNASGANPSVTWEQAAGQIEESTLKIRLTKAQALQRMKVEAAALGVPLNDFEKLDKYSSQRMECRYLSIKLSFKGGRQQKKLAQLIQAMTPVILPNPNGGQNLKIYPAPISWRIWMKGGQVYARAQWEEPEAPQASWSDAGCLGLDINGWGVAWSWCDKEGNPAPSTKVRFGDVKIDWKNATSRQTLHRVRVAAKKLVNLALARNCPIGIENLEFDKKKASLRYERAEYAKALSSFAYNKLIDAVMARAKKYGVQVVFVNPAWTSVSGWAKYGVDLGMNVDQAAAFAIARKAALSRPNLPQHKTKEVEKAKRKGETIAVACRLEELTLRQKEMLAIKQGKLTSIISKVARLKKKNKTSQKIDQKNQKQDKEFQDPMQIEGQSSTLSLAESGTSEAGVDQWIKALKKISWKCMGSALGKSRTTWPKQMACLDQEWDLSRGRLTALKHGVDVNIELPPCSLTG